MHTGPQEPIVRLNIGGVRYCTTACTLVSRGESFFTGLLSGKMGISRDNDGCIFIDRNGRFFEPLLDFLRTGKWRWPDGISRPALVEEASFYGIQIDEMFEERIKEIAHETLKDTLYRRFSTQKMHRVEALVLAKLEWCARNGEQCRTAWFMPQKTLIASRFSFPPDQWKTAWRKLKATATFPRPEWREHVEEDEMMAIRELDYGLYLEKRFGLKLACRRWSIVVSGAGDLRCLTAPPTASDPTAIVAVQYFKEET